MLSSIEIAHLFPVLHAKLIDLLRALAPNDWQRPTVAGTWTVKDVAAHLLDTQLRLVSRLTGAAPAVVPFDVSGGLVAAINRMNADGVARYRMLQPAELIAQMEKDARRCADYYRSLDPWGDAPFGVSWAGEENSTNWFHVAREFTERWHHQQQIRLATGRPGIMTRPLYYPVLDCFMRALPYTYRTRLRAPGIMARINIAGTCGGVWYLVRDADPISMEAEDRGRAAGAPGSLWRLSRSPEGRRVSETTIPQEIAWRIFTKGISHADAVRRIRVKGDPEVGLHVLEAIAIVG